jgi:integrase
MSNSSNPVTLPQEKKRKKYGKFTVQRKKHSTGTVYWRVAGTINGRRYRKNFQDEDKAKEEKQRLDLQQRAEQNYEKVVVTSLNREQCEEAKIAFKMLEGRRKPLSFYVKYAIDRYREAEFEVTVEIAVDEYLRHKRIEQGRNIITEYQLKRITTQLEAFKKAHGSLLIGEIDPKLVRATLDAKYGKNGDQHVSPKTFNNKRGYLGTFFKFCVLQDWIVFNPIDKIAPITVKANRGSAETITAEQAAILMEDLEKYDNDGNCQKGFLVPYFALCLFAGIRPDIRIGEIGRLRSKDVRLDTGVVLIEPEVSKVDEKRSIKIQPNLRLWLEKYPLDQYPIIPSRLEHHRRKFRAEHKLPHNVLRHTFISMTVAAFKSVGDAALQAGNSESIIRKHYLDLKTEAEADDFWRITPEGTSLPSNLVKLEGRFEESKGLKAV